MTTRTTRSTLSFRAPFLLAELDEAQPAGDYLVETDEERIETISRVAWRKVGTFLNIPSIARTRNLVERIGVDPAGLDAAHLRDCGLTL
jgi:hypothetical protein